MPGILPDNNIQGQFDVLLEIFRSATWCEEWESLQLTVETFTRLGLSPEAPDSVLWQTCQGHEVVLFTANRNDKGPDSLEAALREFNNERSLPVITLADPQRFNWDRTYVDRVVAQLLEYLMDLDNYRGVGRLYVP